MFNNIRSTFNAFRKSFKFRVSYGRVTTTSIVADVAEKVAQLQAVAQSERAAAVAAYNEADRLESKGNDHVDEAAKASRLAANFSRLLD